jgi:ankyrin repeat protein
VCQFHSLSKCLSHKDIRNALSSLPRTLDETYERILVNIPIDYQSKALTALQWIIYSGKELSLDQVSDAIIINPQADPPFSLADRPPEPRWILETLPGLVTIGGASQKLEIAHFSVVEYLESPRIMDTPVNMFRLDPSEANILLLKGCVNVLKSHSHLVNQTFLKDNNGESQSFEVSPLCDYACEHWYKHVELLKPPIEEEIKSLVLAFAVNVDSILQGYFSELPMTIWTNPSWTERCPSEPLEKVLHIASRSGLTSIVTIALDAGANINLTLKDGPTALQRAIDGNWPETLRALVDAGADVNFECIHKGLLTPLLQLAVYLSQKSTVKILLDAGADVNYNGGEYGSALQAASWSGNEDIIKLLLNAGADVNLKGGPYGSALQAASYWGDADSVKLLLDAGADVNQEGRRYSSALRGAWTGRYDGIMNLLLDVRADVNQEGGEFGSALQAASWRGYADIVKLLLDAGADVNLEGWEFGSALQTASWSGYADIVKLLLDAGADVNQEDGRYGSALRRARTGGYDGIVNLLLSAGAKDDEDRSAE